MLETSLLAVLAHPDDETFRLGGTLSLLARRGVRVHVLTATRGQAGSCGEPPLCTPEELPALREGELRCACAALGLEPPRLLDYQDGRLAEARFETLIAEILAVIEAVQPQVMLTFGPDGLSGHPDHIVIGRAAQEAYNRAPQIAALYTAAVPVSLAQKLGMRQVRPIPDDRITLHVDVSPAWEVKRAAIRCHATQLSSTPLLLAPEEHQRLFFGQEYFVKAAGGRNSNRTPMRDFLLEILKDYRL